MSESNPIIPSSSQGNELLDDSVNKGLEASQISECDVSSVSESDKPESAKSNASAALGSKIARPTGLKLPSGGNPAVASSRIARLCNNSSKPTATPNQNLLSSK